jgi:hypothetical protein
MIRKSGYRFSEKIMLKQKTVLRFQPALSLTPARKNFCGSTASPSIRVS